jgi:hypothetical protein
MSGSISPSIRAASSCVPRSGPGRLAVVATTRRRGLSPSTVMGTDELSLDDTTEVHDMTVTTPVPPKR